MSSPIGGSHIPEQIGQAGGVKMNVREYFNACKNETMSTPKAVFSAIKFAFSSQTSKQQKINDLQQQPQSAPTHQVSSQRAAATNSAPKFTLEKSLERSDWDSLQTRENKNHRTEPGDAKSPKEAAQYVMKQLQAQFPDHVIDEIGYLPTFGHASSLTMGVQIRPRDDEFGEPRCISVITQTGGAPTRMSSNDFLEELNRLNQ